jgi:hypothetical protein
VFLTTYIYSTVQYMNPQAVELRRVVCEVSKVGQPSKFVNVRDQLEVSWMLFIEGRGVLFPVSLKNACSQRKVQ